MSRVHYLIQVWVGHQTLLKKFQVIVNNAARFVCNADRRMSTKTLMDQCKWMFIPEYADYFTLISLWNYKNRNIPQHFSFVITHGPDHTLTTHHARLHITQSSFRWKGTSLWNTLPLNIRSIPSLPRFKTAAKNWILQKRTRPPDQQHTPL